MSSPGKPWNEKLNNMVNDFTNLVDSKKNCEDEGSNDKIPPPVPARPNYSPTRPYNTFFNSGLNPFSPYSNGYPSLYSPYNCNYPNGLSGYSRFGYNRYPYSSNNEAPLENDFIRLMDESCGPAFQSLESIVQSVASLSTMVESTYFAVYSSFRAVLAVALQLSSLRDHFTDITTKTTIFRALKRLMRQILHFLGLIQQDTVEEEAWSSAHLTNRGDNLNLPLNSDGIYNSPLVSAQSKSSLPLLLFFAVIIGGPWLIWTIFSNMSSNKCKINNQWSTGEDEHYVATALYQFQSESPRELSFRPNQRIIIAPKELQPRIRGWLLASIDNKTGLIPINYVKIIEFKSSKSKMN